MWWARFSGLGFQVRLRSRYCLWLFHLKAWLGGGDLLPRSLKGLLVGFSSIWSVGLRALASRWLLAEGLLQFFGTWASPKGGSHMAAGFHQNEWVREQETGNKMKPESFCDLISETIPHYLETTYHIHCGFLFFFFYHCGFYLHFLNDWCCWTPFHMCISRSYILWWNK